MGEGKTSANSDHLHRAKQCRYDIIVQSTERDELVIINFEPTDTVIFETNNKRNFLNGSLVNTSVEVGDLEGMALQCVFVTKTEWNVESRNS